MKNHVLTLLSLVIIFCCSCKKKDTGGDSGGENPPPTQETTETGLITWSPAVPNDNDAITITFDASRGNGGLNNVSGDVYVYTGVITDKSNSPTDWKYVKSPSFTAADPAAKMQVAGANKYSITLTPRTFYNVPATDKILKLVMLFRNADGSKSGRNSDNSDIYLPVTESGKLSVRFTSPEFEPLYTPTPVLGITTTGSEVNVSAASSKTANLTLSLNGTSFASASSASKISGKVKVTSIGNQTIRISANDGSTTAESTFTFTVNGDIQVADLPAGAKDGVTLLNGGTSAIFNLYAPKKQFAYVIGDFNDWQSDTKTFMKKTPDGTRWWVQVDGLDPNTEYGYQYLVDGKLRVADPYGEKVLDPSNDGSISASVYPSPKAYPTGKTTGIVSTFKGNPAAYSWKNASFTRPDKNNLVIYELHLRDFIAAHDYTTLKDTLNYLSRLGVNAIELMPVNEFEGNSSWGYNPSFYFAPDKYYGTKNALKALIDECHSRGIAVIFDMVLNHSFGQSPMVQLYFDGGAGKPSLDNPWFNADATHPYNVGYDFNHESAATKYFTKKVLEFWLKEYRADGFRFDLSKGFTQKNSGTNVATWSAYDASRIAIWKDYNTYIKSVDNSAYVILEHFADDLEEKELAAEGMLLWNNVNGAFNEATMGYVSTSDISRGFYDRHGFTQANLVTYMESHDEERLMFKNLNYGNSSGSYSTKELTTALKREELAAVFLLAMPGPKMIWQFGEVGYDVSIDQNGRTGEKPIRWNYQDVAARKALYTVYAKMIHFKTANSVFNTTNVQYSLTDAIKYIRLTNAQNTVMIVGNFDVTAKTASVTFPQNGVWTDRLTGSTVTISGGTYAAVMAPGEYHVFTISPLN